MAKTPAPKTPAPKAAPKSPEPAEKPGDLLSMIDGGLTVPTLDAIIERANAMRGKKFGSEKSAAIKRIKADIATFEIEAGELYDATPRKKAAAGKAKAEPKKAASKKATVAKRASPAVKYRSPTGEGWSGRGRQPKWLSAAEAEGKKREDFAV